MGLDRIVIYIADYSRLNPSRQFPGRGQSVIADMGGGVLRFGLADALYRRGGGGVRRVDDNAPAGRCGGAAVTARRRFFADCGPSDGALASAELFGGRGIFGQPAAGRLLFAVNPRGFSGRGRAMGAFQPGRGAVAGVDLIGDRRRGFDTGGAGFHQRTMAPAARRRLAPRHSIRRLCPGVRRFTSHSPNAGHQPSWTGGPVFGANVYSAADHRGLRGGPVALLCARAKAAGIR